VLVFAGLCQAEPPDRDQYGGWKKRSFEATGFFRLEKAPDRWWLVTPEGNAYLIHGMDHCGLDVVTQPYNLNHWTKELGWSENATKAQRLKSFYRKKVYGATLEDHIAVMDRFRRIAPNRPMFSADSSWSVCDPPRMPDTLGPQCANHTIRAARFNEVYRAVFARPDFIGWGWCGWMDKWESPEPYMQHGGLQDAFGKWHQPIAEAMSCFGRQMYEIALNNSGSAEAPIVYAAYPGNNVFEDNIFVDGHERQFECNAFGAISYGSQWSPACVLLTAAGDVRVVESCDGSAWPTASPPPTREQHCEEASAYCFVGLVDGTWKHRRVCQTA
jgi:hypothetical protein